MFVQCSLVMRLLYFLIDILLDPIVIVPIVIPSVRMMTLSFTFMALALRQVRRRR